MKPRVVIAGVPMRTPLVTIGFSGSFGEVALPAVAGDGERELVVEGDVEGDGVVGG